jgi:DNA-binding PadR family transcriptional regulator
MESKRLSRYKRAEDPPRMQLTERDMQVILGVYAYRVLRREQLQELFFPSKNTANERLKRLYQHGFLERRWLPVEYGQGTSQAMYLLAERGVDVVAQQLGIDRASVDWRESYNRVGALFLEHLLLVNQMRIVFSLAAARDGIAMDSWITEEELKARREFVQISTAGGTQRRVAVIPDGYFLLNFGDKRAHFFLEVDRATEANKRWAQKVQAYLAYTQSGKYTERYGTRSLRVLTVTTGEKRLANLKRATEEVGGGAMFWFTTFAQATPEQILGRAAWQVAGREGYCGI